MSDEPKSKAVKSPKMLRPSSPDIERLLGGQEYLQQLPEVIPADKVLVHNSVRPAAALGARGFRAWLMAPDLSTLELCPCEWARKLGPHFRVGRAAGEAELAME